MLNAVLHGKAGRVSLDGDTKPISWKQLYKKREDLLTSAFFTRFTYLSGEIQHRLLQSWLSADEDFTDFKEVEYWPHYDLPKNVNGVYVEPDLLLSFGSCDVLIEVKPPGGGSQSRGQWEKQLTGYFGQGPEVNPLYFLAVGKIENVVDADAIDEIVDKYDQLKVVKAIEWKPIAVGLYSLQRSCTLGAQDNRVISDMLMALDLYGIQAYEPKWSDFTKLPSQLDISVMQSWPVSSKKSKEVRK